MQVNFSHAWFQKYVSLQARGYSVWIDIEKMQGSTVEAMADAVEGAAVMCYGVSRAYKESANCRLEAQYAYLFRTPRNEQRLYRRILNTMI